MQAQAARRLPAPNRLAELRAERGLRPVHVAAAIDVDQATLHRYEQNKVRSIPDDKKFALAAFFDVSVAYLMGWSDDRQGGT